MEEGERGRGEGQERERERERGRDGSIQIASPGTFSGTEPLALLCASAQNLIVLLASWGGAGGS